MLYPPNAVVRNGELHFGIEIETGEDDRSHRQQEQQNRNRTNLAFPVHGLRAALPRVGWRAAGMTSAKVSLLISNFAAMSFPISGTAKCRI